VSEPIIQLRSLTKKYGDYTAVNGLTLDIYRGEIFGLLGPNGAGKSTTILMMLGLTEPYFGSVHVCGVDATRDPIQVKRRVGYLPDDVGFYEDRTGLDNLMFTAMLNGRSQAEAEAKALELLERVGLTEAKDKRTGAYSRGMRQRLGLADVLIKDPEVIILDEPTLGIDPKGVRELLELIRQLSRDMGITVLLSSHHLHQVQEICDRVGLFVKGRLLAVGNIAELSQKLFGNEPYAITLKATPIDAAFIGKLKALDGVVSVEETEPGQVTVQCRDDLSAAIARTAVEHGAAVLGLSKKEYGLDEIYHRYFAGGESDEQAQPARKG
jgi:ABC-2 type transport system ATP-binding protein